MNKWRILDRMQKAYVLTMLAIVVAVAVVTLAGCC